MLLELSDHPGLVLWQHARMDFIDPGLAGDPLRRTFIVAGHEDGLDTALAQRGDRLGRVGAEHVTEGEDSHCPTFTRHRDDRPPGDFKSLDPDLEPLENDAGTHQETRT